MSADLLYAVRAMVAALRLRIANARRILKPLQGKDRTVDDAISALDGVPKE
jgi:hypothetical protein